jgi:hypothetical protein
MAEMQGSLTHKKLKAALPSGLSSDDNADVQWCPGGFVPTRRDKGSANEFRRLVWSQVASHRMRRRRLRARMTDIALATMTAGSGFLVTGPFLLHKLPGRPRLCFVKPRCASLISIGSC